MDDLLIIFLNAQRDRALAVVDGLSDDQLATSVLAAKPLSAAPLGRHGQGDEDQVTDLRFIVLHMLEETARHLGHLDAARELIDGSTGLGQDDL